MQTFRTTHCTIASLTLALVLSACGGGSGSGSGGAAGTDATGAPGNGTDATVGTSDPGNGGSGTTDGNGTANPAQDWVDAAGDVNASPDTKYIARDDGAPVHITLPSNDLIAVDQTVRIEGAGAGGWQIIPNPGQVVKAAALASWTETGPLRLASDSEVTSVAASYDGSSLFLSSSGTAWGKALRSDDGGMNWTAVKSESPSALNFTSVACSDDGATLALTVSSTTNWPWVFTTHQGGAAGSWSALDVGVARWKSVATSFDGTKMVAVEALDGTTGGRVYSSTVGGGPNPNWTDQTTPAGKRNWQSIASSKDGNHVVAVVGGGYIYTADTTQPDANGLYQWVERQTPDGMTHNWVSVASSRDGSTLLAADNGGTLWVSTNIGADWTSVGEPGNWTSVAISGDGIMLASKDAQAYESTNGGQIWTPGPAGSLGDLALTSVAISGDGGRLIAASQSDKVFTALTRTTPGTGSINGTQSDSIELVYRGEGVFEVKSFNVDGGGTIGGLTIK